MLSPTEETTKPFTAGHIIREMPRRDVGLKMFSGIHKNSANSTKFGK